MTVAATCAEMLLLLGSVAALVGSAAFASESVSPGASPLVRHLTATQYRRAIEDVFGPTIHVEGQFEPDLREAGLLAVGAGRVGVTASGLEQYDAMARGIAAQVVDEAHRATLVPCNPRSEGAPDDRCAERFFERAGPLLYRRALRPGELRQFVELANSATRSLGSFYTGLALSLAGMLESPQFLFRVETGEPDPTRPGAWRLDGYSTASQLSFFLWNSSPDAQLLAAAANGGLQHPATLAREVERLLASSRVEAGIRAFFSDMLQFDAFDTLAKDAKIYPKWTSAVGRDAREQTLRTVVDMLITRHADYRDLFTTRRTLLTPLLGSLYRVSIPQNEAPWQPYKFSPEDPRMGIQSHASFVALHSHEGLSSPTLRGKALREILLCEPIPAPPGNVNFDVAQDTHNPNFRTMRERLTAHRTDPTCSGCHKLMDPIGLALENFDSDASYRTSENAVPIDTSGELDGVQFRDSAGLAHAIHDNPATSACLVRRLYSYATGRPAARSDMPWIRELEKSFVADRYRVPELLRQIATSPNLYRVTAPPLTVASQELARVGLLR
jgi:Protein of unknown function (DUF1592)/Protein of unknown function (DUF1588)/Protein of unknown function (DUF1585)/Protein of unknown function (DUF1595)/Protein of unknown function (DUF1587)